MSHWQNKVIVVTGGSQGLGLAIAQNFATRGGTVIVLARDEKRLAEAAASSPNIDGIQADVLDDASVDAAIERIIQQHQKIDVWVNNVGKSSRSDFANSTLDEYQSMMEINFYSVLRCSMAVLPCLEKSSGSLVNIGSLASKTGWRNMSPYAASKHALAAFCHQVRLEASSNVNCLLVCPGPIQRPDAGARYAAQTKNLDATAAQPGAGVKLKGICPTKLSRKIEAAVRRRKKELIVPGYTRILFSLMQLSPTIGDWILRKFAK
jgi:short-subunit dehydrogenase